MYVQKKAKLVQCAVINLFSFTESTDLSKPRRFTAFQGFMSGKLQVLVKI